MESHENGAPWLSALMSANSPLVIRVSAGDIVVWINKDFVPHTTTAKNKSWGSGTIKKDGQWQIVVRTGMPEDYFCKFHPSMKGRVQIVD